MSENMKNTAPAEEVQDINEYKKVRMDKLAELQQQVESFLASRQTENYVLDVVTARQSSYDAYFNMQNAIVAAYKKLNRHPIRIREGVKDE